MQLQKVSRNLIGMLKSSGVLCPTSGSCKYNYFCPIFFLYSYSLTLFLVGMFVCFSPSLTIYTLSCQKPCLPGKSLQIWSLAALPISYPLLPLSLYFFCHQDPVFLFKTPDLLHLPFISPLLPLQDLMLVWSVLFFISLCLSSTKLALPSPSCRNQSLLVLVFLISQGGTFPSLLSDWFLSSSALPELGRWSTKSAQET